MENREGEHVLVEADRGASELRETTDRIEVNPNRIYVHTHAEI